MIEALHTDRRSFLFALLFQKAEPVRLVPGRAVRGTLRNRQQMEYELTAKAGQKLVFRLQSSPLHSTMLKIVGLNGRELSLNKQDGERWTVTVPDSGDLVVFVSRVQTARGRSAFSLTLGRL
jgi:hypothetical protein